MVERLLLSLLIIAAAFVGYQVWQRRLLRQVSAVTMGRGKPAVLYFRSDSCAPCVTQARFLQQLEAQMGDRITIEKIDADVDRERAQRYRVFTVPTTLIVDAAGAVRHANFGLTPAHKLAEQLQDGMDGDGI